MFDMTHDPIRDALDVMESKAPIADKRRAALDAFAYLDNAPNGAPGHYWRDLAVILAKLVPVPKAAPTAPDPDGPEWCEYPEARHRVGTASGGVKRNTHHKGRVAVFRFADGEAVRVMLRHHVKESLPDWARAARCAVRFYKARRASRFMRLVLGAAVYGIEPSEAEAYANGCAVPEIAAATDIHRGTSMDVIAANEATRQMRDGPAYLADLWPHACALGGDWRKAWRGLQAARFAGAVVPIAFPKPCPFAARVAASFAA